jgi:hypothetical protein
MFESYSVHKAEEEDRLIPGRHGDKVHNVRDRDTGSLSDRHDGLFHFETIVLMSGQTGNKVRTT